MKMISSLTTFIKKTAYKVTRGTRSGAYLGRLNSHLVQSEKPVIVFEHPRILHSSDSVEEATTFLLKAKETGKVSHAGVYEHDTQFWHRVDTPGANPSRQAQPAQPRSAATVGGLA